MSDFTWLHGVFNVFNFLLFFIVLAKFAGPPIKKALDDREAALQASIRDAEAARKAAEAGLSATQARLANVDTELADLLKQAQELAAKQAVRVEAAAKDEAERARVTARAEIERERQAAVNDVRKLLLQQAFERAAADLQTGMTAERQRQLVGSLIQKVEDGSLALK